MLTTQIILTLIICIIPFLLLKDQKYKFLVPAAICFISYISYEVYFEQIYAKRYGGVLTVSLPSGAQFLSATWKDDALWYAYFNEKDNECIFREQSKFGLLEGSVLIKGCNPK